MIQKITIRNFKSLGEVTVDLAPVTVLIGRSGVGKSNFLRAIRFLRNYLLQPDAAVTLEGGWPRIWPFGNSAAPLSFSVEFTIPGYPSNFTYEVAFKSHGQNPLNVFVSREKLQLGLEVVFDWNEKLWLKWAGEGSAPLIQSQIYLNAFPTLSEAVLAYTAWTSGIGWYDFPASVFAQTSPDTQRSQNQLLFGRKMVTLGGLNDTAENYLDIIRAITQDLRDQRARRQILARLKQINATIDSLELDSIIDPKRVVVAHKVGGSRIGLDLSQESDGFRRYYAHLLALYQTPPKQVLMFEEPENGVYPGALLNLAEEFRASPSAGRGQVLLTTQSPELLDGFSPEQIRVVELDPYQITTIGPLDPDQAEAVRARLLEPGELLTVDTARIGQTA